MEQPAEQPSASSNTAAPASSADSSSLEVLPGVIGAPLSDPPTSESESDSTAGAGLEAPAGEASAASAAGAQDPPAAPVPEPPKATKFTIGGVEFEDQAAADHSVRTLRGMHKALKTQNEQFRLEILEHKQARAELERQLAALPNRQRDDGDAPSAGQPAGDQGARVDEGPDWKLFELLQEKHGLPTAMKWLHRTNLELIQGKVQTIAEELKKNFSEQLAPFQETREEQLELERGAELYNQMLTYQHGDGRAYYPELKEPEVMRQVGTLWRRQGGQRDDLLNARGIHLAIVNYRNYLADQAAGVTSAVSASTTNTSQAPGAPAAATAVGNGSEGQTPTRPPAPQSYQDRLRAETMAAAVSTNELGFFGS